MAFELKLNGYDTGNKEKKSCIFHEELKFWDKKENYIYKNLYVIEKNGFHF